jgi:hypothetical protein
MGGRGVGERAVVSSRRAPADDHVTVAGGEDLLNVEVKIGKRGDIQLEELPSPFMPRERHGKVSAK